WVVGCSDLRSFFFSSRRRHTSFSRDWSSDVCSSDLNFLLLLLEKRRESILEAVAGEFTALANEVRDVVDVEVRTARALSDEEREIGRASCRERGESRVGGRR